MLVRRLILILLIGLFFSESVFAQRTRTATTRGGVRKYTEFKAGMMSPRDTDSGNLLGISFGRRIDNRLFWGFAVDYFRTTFRKTTIVADSVVGGIEFKTEQLELEFTTTIVPILFTMNYEIPFQRNSPVFLRASLGFGWEFVWNKEKNFETGIDRTRRFDGFAGQAAVGVGLRISEVGFIFIDGFYNGAATKAKAEQSVQSLPTEVVLNVSGFGFKFGLRLAGLGY